jgi:hypothetical protein
MFKKKQQDKKQYDTPRQPSVLKIAIGEQKKSNYPDKPDYAPISFRPADAHRDEPSLAIVYADINDNGAYKYLTYDQAQSLVTAISEYLATLDPGEPKQPVAAMLKQNAASAAKRIDPPDIEEDDVEDLPF